MTSSYGKEICARLGRDVRVLNIEDFQDHQAFVGYTTYTCVVTFAKLPPAKTFVVTRFPAGLNGRSDPGSGHTSLLPCERLRAHPWDFATDRAHDALRLLRSEGHPLIERVLGTILQGLRTGANEVFVLDKPKAQHIESTLLVPLITGEHIRRCHVRNTELRLLFPYARNEYGDVDLLSEAELQAGFPNAWNYLCSKRSVLEERSRDSGAPWYA